MDMLQCITITRVLENNIKQYTVENKHKNCFKYSLYLLSTATHYIPNYTLFFFLS
jgi:hypothetical protein